VLSCNILLRNETWILSHSWLQGTRGMWSFFFKDEGWTCSPWPSCASQKKFFSAKGSVRGIVLSWNILLRNETWILSHSWLQGKSGMWRFFYNFEGWTCSPWPSCSSRRFFSAKKIFYGGMAPSAQQYHFIAKLNLDIKSFVITGYMWHAKVFCQRRMLDLQSMTILRKSTFFSREKKFWHPV